MVNFALIDCNNFFVSCERIFRPDLETKPVAVLSNNDGCIIARSDEVKQLGIPMGQPLFKCKDIIQKHNVTLFSSNFALYGDISTRVMNILDQFSPNIEVYSIDEAFIKIPIQEELYTFGSMLQNTVKQWTGIPTRIGIGKTKTLAKAGSYFAKKTQSPVFNTNDYSLPLLLKDMPITEVWGIGRKISKKLIQNGITTAYQFTELPEQYIKKTLSVTGLRTQLELKGMPCIKLEEQISSRKSILSSRSFGKKLSHLYDLKSALANNVCTAAEKCRKQKLLAKTLQVFIKTSHIRNQYHSKSIIVNLPQASNSSFELITYALSALEKIYIPEQSYAKSGILLLGLCNENEYQKSLFTSPQLPNHKTKPIMTTLDQLNKKWGKRCINPAIINWNKQAWKMNQNQRSPRYTTVWKEIPIVS